MSGTLEVVIGGMYAGKSEEMIRRLRRAEIAKRKVVAFKPAADTRYATGHLSSHDGSRYPAIEVEHPTDILAMVGDAQCVGIDEAQFFDNRIVEVCLTLVAQGKRVVVAGLDLDYRGVPFGPMPALAVLSDDFHRVHAICVVCGADASRSQRIVANREQVLVGGEGAYEARCKQHWSPEPVFSQMERGASEDFDG